MWKGIDVSDNQGVIDWEQVAAAKVSFCNPAQRRSGKADHQFATNLELPGPAIYLCLYISIPTQLTQDAARRGNSRSWNC